MQCFDSVFCAFHMVGKDKFDAMFLLLLMSHFLLMQNHLSMMPSSFLFFFSFFRERKLLFIEKLTPMGNNERSLEKLTPQLVTIKEEMQLHKTGERVHHKDPKV